MLKLEQLNSFPIKKNIVVLNLESPKIVWYE